MGFMDYANNEGKTVDLSNSANYTDGSSRSGGGLLDSSSSYNSSSWLNNINYGGSSAPAYNPSANQGAAAPAYNPQSGATKDPDKGYLSSLADNFSNMLKTDKGAEMFLGGVAGAAKAVIEWQNDRKKEESAKENTELQARLTRQQYDHMYGLRQKEIDADISRRSARAKLGSSVKKK